MNNEISAFHVNVLQSSLESFIHILWKSVRKIVLWLSTFTLLEATSTENRELVSC